MYQDKKRAAKRDDPVSIEMPFEEAVADRLKVKKPGQKTKPKKAQSRERKKRNV